MAETGDKPASLREPTDPGTDTRGPSALGAAKTFFQRGQEAERLGYDAAAQGAAAGLGQLSQFTDFALRRAFIRGVFLRLAEGDPNSALAALKLGGMGDEDTDLALRTLVESWQPTHASPKIRRVLEERFGLTASILAPLMAGSSPNFALAVRAGRVAVGEESWIEFLSLVAAQQAQTDPRAAFDLGAELDGDRQAFFLQRMTEGWAETDPKAAFAWATQTADPELRAQLEASALASWAKHDSAASADRLAQLPPGSAREQAIRQIGANWGAQDTEAALAWAGTLPDGAERQKALDAIRTSAPVGIGLQLQSGREGEYPIVGDLVSSGPAAEAGMFAKGDRIAAIGDANGRMIDVRSRPLNEVIALIRGAPGTIVRIAIIPGNAANSNERRVVQVTRRQLLMRR